MKRHNTKKKCGLCNMEFIATRRYRRYCKSCTPREREKVYRNINLPDKACETCGRNFSPRFHKSKFCSEDCKSIAYAAKNKKNHPKRKCDSCGASYQPKSNLNKYCSDDCRKTHYYEVKRQKNKKKKTKYCVICHQVFKPRRSIDVCCSRECSDRRARKAQAKTIICKSCGTSFIHNTTGVRKYCDTCKQKGRPKKTSDQPCAWCGRTNFPHVNTHATYCSLKCSSKALHANGKGNKVDKPKAINKLIKAILDARYTPTLEDVCYTAEVSETWVREQGLDIENLFKMAGREPSCSFESKFEEMVYYALLDLGIEDKDIQRQKKYDGLRGIRNSLRFDFHIRNINILIEADGEQHNPGKEHPIFETEASQKNDALKNAYAKEQGIPLIRIPYQATFHMTFKTVKEKLTPHLR
ncbi:hypothetical protein Rhal01_03668 [Rubritalea halochordaticola]|uniref:DUF559 domain-containing protein n=1 Tax=Rubritalea halochordaticola TaxID=714537 RepID=A0ABP9V483_9BACT